MRIAHVNDIAFVGSTLTRALRVAGVEADLVEPFRAGATIPYPWKALTLPLRVAGLAAAGLRLRRRYDIAHVHYARLGVVGPLSGLPYVVHCHGSDIRGVTPRSGWGFEVAPIFRGAARVYFSTPDLAPWVAAFRPDAVFLPNPIEVPDRIVESGGRGERDVLIGVRLDPIKGPEEIEATVRALVAIRPGTTFTVIDQGSHVGRVAAAAGSAARIIPPVPHDELPALFRAHRVAIGQMRVGAIGNFELEAMAAALPVASAFSYPDAYPERPPIVDGPSPADRADTLARLLDDPAACVTFGERAASWVAANHSTTAIAARLIADYAAILLTPRAVAGARSRPPNSPVGSPAGATRSSSAARSKGRRPRIMIVTSLFPTADRPEVGAFVARRVDDLRRRGVDVVVAAASTYRQPAVIRHLVILGRALTARGPIDGVESHVLYPAGLLGLAVARLRRRPFIAYAHGADVGVSARRSPIDRLLARVVARNADALVTNSAATAAHVRELGGMASVIPPGVDFERFHPSDRLAARAALGLPADARIALYVGALSRRKGADVFADALGRADDWLGVMVGNGELELPLRTARVRLVGAVAPDDVPGWIAAADAVVVPSREEPLGLAAIEALASGVPVIASRVGGLQDLVQDGVNGCLVPPGDPSAIVNALGRLEDDAFHEALARAARSSVASFDVRATGRSMAAVWRSLGVDAEA